MEPVRTEERPRAIPAPSVTISSLIGKVAAYSPDGAEELIAGAYNAAHAAHRGQTRKSGEPFVYHPLATAGILAELHLDPTTIAAALLQDRKSTRLNSSHANIPYAVFCLKKKINTLCLRLTTSPTPLTFSPPI